jgi:type II secretory pathway pseudopilin PulG
LNGHSRSTLFLIEQLVVILIFAICSAVCISIFVESYMMGHRTLEVNNAIRAAGNGAESYKASGGDAQETARVLGGINNQADYDEDLLIYYNDQWNPCEKEQALYVLRIIRLNNPAPSLVLAEVTVSRMDGEELFNLRVATRRDG